MTRCPSVEEYNQLITVIESRRRLVFPISFLSTGCRIVLPPILNVRENDLSGLEPESYGTGTRSFSSSNQLRTMLIRVGMSGFPPAGAWTNTNCVPSGVRSQSGTIVAG